MWKSAFTWFDQFGVAHLGRHAVTDGLPVADRGFGVGEVVAGPDVDVDQIGHDVRVRRRGCDSSARRTAGQQPRDIARNTPTSDFMGSRPYASGRATGARCRCPGNARKPRSRQRSATYAMGHEADGCGGNRRWCPRRAAGRLGSDRTASATPSTCDGAGCVPYVNHDAQLGAHVRLRTRATTSAWTRPGNTLACSSKSQWVSFAAADRGAHAAVAVR